MSTTLLDKQETRIRRMFGQVAPRYDLLNHLLSLNVDRWWRWRTTRLAPPEGDAPILDVCTGTGDLALAYDRAAGKQVPIVGADFCHEMLVRARAKMANLVAFLQEFQKEPKMHRIKSLSIERSDISARKEADYMTVQIGIEALIILDADQVQKRANVPDKATLALETSATLRQGPNGLALIGWSLSGGSVQPLNPPLVAIRNYADIARKNIFVGPPVEKEDSGLPTRPPDDEIVNMMKFTRFIGLINDGKQIEAKLNTSLDTILRYQAALKRDLYRAIAALRAIQGQGRGENGEGEYKFHKWSARSP